MGKAFAHLRRRPRAPGLVGVHGRVRLAAGPIIGERMRQLYMSLREGSFLKSRKRVRLVLLSKEDKPAESPSA